MDNYQLIIEAAIARAESEKKIKNQVKEIQKSIGALNLDVKVSDSDVKSSIAKVNKLVQEGSQVNIKAKRDELRAQQMIFQEQKLATAKELADRKKVMSTNKLVTQEEINNRKNVMQINNQATAEDLSNRRKAIQLQKVQVQEAKIGQTEILKVAKATQQSNNLNSGKVQFGNQLSTYLNQNTKLSSSLKKEILEIQSAIKTVDKTGLSNLKNKFKEVTSEADKLGKSGASFGSKLKTNILNFAQFLSAATISMIAINSVKDMIIAVTDLDKAYISLKKVTNESPYTYAKFFDTATNSAKKLGAEISTIVNQTAEWAKAGFDLKNSSQMAEVSTIFTNVGDVDAATAVSDIVTPLKAFNIEAKNAIQIVDKLNQVDNEFSVSSAGIGDGLKNSASALALAGNDIDQSIAMITGGSEITQSASEMGTAIKILSMRLRGMKGSLQEIGEEYENIQSVSKIQTQVYNLTKGNVNIIDDLDPTKFKSTYEIMKGISKVWSDISEVDQAQLLETIAGKNRGNDVAALIQSYQSGQVDKALETSITSQNSALNEQSKYMEGIEYSSAKMKANFQELASNTINSNWIKGFYDLASGVLSATNAVGGLIPVLSTLAVVYLSFTKSEKLNFLQGFVTSLFQARIAAGTTSVAIGGVTLSIKVLTGIISGGLLIALPLVLKLFDSIIVTLDEQKEKLDAASSAYDESKTALESITTELKTQSKLMNDLLAKDNLTYAEEGELEKLQKITEELRFQEEIAKRNEEKAKKVLAVTAVGTYDKQFGSTQDTFQPIESQITDNQTMFQSYGVSVEEDNIANLIAAYREYGKLKDTAMSNGNASEVTAYGTSIKQVTDYLWDDIDALQQQKTDMKDYYDVIKDTPYGEMDSEQKKIYDNYTAIEANLKLIYSTVNPAKWNTIKLDSIFDTEGLEKTKEELVKMAKDGTLDESTITGYSKLNAVLSGSNLILGEGQNSVKAFVDGIKAMAIETAGVTGATEEEAKVVLSLSEALKAMESSGQLISTVKDEFKELGYISSSSLQTIIDKYPELEGVVSDYLAGLASTEDVLAGLKTAYDTDFDNYESAIIEKKQLDEGFYSKVIDNLSDDVKEKAKSYGIDFDNYKNLQEQKLALDKEYARQVYILESAKLASDKANSTASTSTDMRDAATAIDMTDNFGAAESSLAGLKSIIDSFDTSLSGTLNLKGYEGANGDKTADKKEKDKKEFSKVFDWFEIRIDKLKDKAQKAIDSVSKYLSYTNKNKQIDIAVKAKVDEKSSLKSIQNSYTKMAKNVGLSPKYQKLVDEGGLDVQTITNEKLANQIDEYTKWKDAAKAVGIEIATIDTLIKDLKSQKLDNIISAFDTSSSYNQSKIGKRESLISLRESQGKVARESDYDYLIKLNNDLVKNLASESLAYSKEFNQQVKDGVIKVGSPEYKEGLAYLNDLESESRKTEAAIYDLNVQVRDIRWESFDTGITKINNMRDELTGLADLITDAESVDSTGNYTDKGLTKLGLYTQQMAESRKLVSEYGLAINKLKSDLKNHNITQKQYDEELAINQGLQRDAVNAVQETEASIISLAKARVDIEIQSINDETTAFKDLIDAKKDALSAEKDLHDYQKSISEQSTSIGNLQKQIGVLKSSTDRKDIAQRLKLESDLATQQDKLKEDQYAHSVDVQSEALDDEYTDYEKSQNDKITVLEKTLEDEETLIKNTLDKVMIDTSIVSVGIEALATEHGLIITDSIVTPWEKATSAIALYKEALEGLPSTTKIDTSTIDSNSSGGATHSGTSKTATTTKSSNTKTTTPTTTKSSTSGLVSSIVALIKYGQSGNSVKAVQTALKALGYNIGSTGVDGKFGDSTLSALKKFQSNSGIHSDGIVGDDTKKKFKLKGYKNGISKLLEDQLAWTQENGGEIITRPSSNAILTPMVKGDGVINNDLTKNLMDWGKINPNTSAFNISTKMPNLSALTAKQSGGITVHYDNLLNVGTLNGSNIDEVHRVVKNALDKNNATLVTIIKQNR